jgi:hypothetical protein
MTSKQFTRDSHYVSRIYLKQWASEDARLWAYRILVSNQNVPKWKLSSIRGIAYRAHLYTRIIAGGQTDEIEQWLAREFEAPAEGAIRKIVSDSRLSPGDWKLLIRFLAAQDVRTPSRLSESLERWNKSLPGLFQTTLEKSIQELETAKKEGRPVRQPDASHTELMPMRILIKRNSESETAIIKVKSVAGRGLWLYSLKHLLTKTTDVLLNHKWTILKPPKGVNWITSDDPVIKLNYFHAEKYSFKGGWDSKGTEILLPISPNHLMYTKIGGPCPRRGTIVSEEVAAMFQRFTAEHAHRFVFAQKIEPQVESIRPRVVDRDLFNEEEDKWKRWHDRNTLAERKLYEKG